MKMKPNNNHWSYYVFQRIVFAALMFIAAVSLPFYVVAFLAILYSIFFPSPFELILFGFMIDAYFGVGLFSYTYTLAAAVIVLVREIVVRYMNLIK